MTTTYPQEPGFKTAGTSQEAAVATGAGRARLLRDVVLALLAQRGPLTADECAAAMGESILSVRPRMSELSKNGQGRSKWGAAQKRQRPPRLVLAVAQRTAPTRNGIMKKLLLWICLEEVLLCLGGISWVVGGWWVADVFRQSDAHGVVKCLLFSLHAIVMGFAFFWLSAEYEKRGDFEKEDHERNNSKTKTEG